MLKIRDLLQLDNLKNFVLVAGEGGLESIVTSAGILDYEFVEIISNRNENAFEKDSFVVSTLLFAKGRPEIIVDAILELINQGVSALAYKTVLFNELPKEALRIADRLNFPIFKFDHGDAFVEDVIYDIMEECKKASNMRMFDATIKKFVEKEIDQYEAKRIIYTLKPNFQKNIVCYSISMGKNQNLVRNFSKNYKPSDRLRKKSIVGIYKNELILILSSKENRHDILLEDFFLANNFEMNKCNIGISEVNRLDEILWLIEQSRVAMKIGVILGKAQVSTSELGTFMIAYKFMNTYDSERFQSKYLNPILENDSEDRNETFKTLYSYVFNFADFDKVADQMCCHKNTIRYRIKKYEKIIGLENNQIKFYENVAFAMKLYILEKSFK